MKILTISRLLPAVSLACALGAAPIAMAQSQGGTMAPMSHSMSMSPAKPAHSLPSGDRFKTASAALAHCPGGTVVWSTLTKSHVYHAAGSKYYGKTKHGAYVCEADAQSFGYHAAKN